MDFLYVDEVVGFERTRADGVLGLNARQYEPVNFVKELYNQRFIERNIFALDFTHGQEEDSNIWFGGYPIDRLNELNGNSNLT
jgi:hypothetical protein